MMDTALSLADHCTPVPQLPQLSNPVLLSVEAFDICISKPL